MSEQQQQSSSEGGLRKGKRRHPGKKWEAEKPHATKVLITDYENGIVRIGERQPGWHKYIYQDS